MILCCPFVHLYIYLSLVNNNKFKLHFYLGDGRVNNVLLKLHMFCFFDSPSVCLSRLSIFLSVCPISPFFCLFVQFVAIFYLFFRLSSLEAFLSVCPSICLSFCSFFLMSLCRVCLPSLCLSFCLFFLLCLSCLFPPPFLSVCLSVHIYVISSVCLSGLSIPLFVLLAICLCLSTEYSAVCDSFCFIILQDRSSADQSCYYLHTIMVKPKPHTGPCHACLISLVLNCDISPS